MSGTSTSKKFYKHKHGEVEKLTYNNYPRWKGCVKFPLMAVKGWKMLNSLEDRPDDGDEELDDYESRAAEGLSIIYNSCSENIQQTIRELDDPVEMWQHLKNRYDTGSSAIGRLALKRRFDQIKPLKNESINVFLDNLMSIYNILEGTPQEVTEETLKAHIYTHVPPEFRGITRILQREEQTSIEEVMDALREDEETRHSYDNYQTGSDGNLQNEQLAFASHGTTYRGGYKGRGGHRRMLCSNPYLPEPKTGTQKPYIAECFDCGGIGHRFADCPIETKTQEQYQKGKEAYDRFQKSRKYKQDMNASGSVNSSTVETVANEL